MATRYTVYKSDISYFSGKLEAYLRYKEIPHSLVNCNSRTVAMIAEKTGTAKMPAIEMANGQWLHDTTPMMQWLEHHHPQPSIMPQDPALRFFALLMEDYGDEWLWRPAMWWRWVPKVSRITLGRRIASTMIAKPLAIPLGFYFARRQLNEWLWKDGVDQHNSNDVRDMLYRELEFMEPLFEQQDFLLGSHPSIADFGYFASMFRHFGNDPISAEVMRREGPNTYEWLSRLWNIKQSKISHDISWVWPEADYWQPLLQRIAKDYLPYLYQNAVAFSQGKKRFDYKGNSLTFNGTVTTDYRVFCRQELQREFSLLTKDDQQRVEQVFANVGGIASLHQDGVIDSGLTKDYQLPVDPTTVKAKPTLAKRIFGQPRN
ncbi:MAG: glutathione S-transferase [Oceanicoccus sp.]|uniref:glutathione S-transferase family protein n=1 Tax=Oceanicoccus sp. TaxID=2691044 RepID=UPI00262FAB9C|nr:glutathione S-transferase family protein [Oceanicoccus sp.]MCP3906587.1 glutathione S-transferase [Oceanicoccus sp.]MDG1773512.1 glutathione S-transferase [Oceanicoccus sp.]